MTTTLRAWATRIPVTLHGIRAEALCEQVRSIDIVRLNEELYGRINPETLVEIQEIIARLIGVYTASGPLLT
jgi:mRNA-degrading endonuclease toxin of MazEF toxin-antitoxin module